MKKIIILIVVLVIILALGIGGYFGVKKLIQLGKEKGWDFLQEQIEKEKKGEGILDKFTGEEEEEEEEEEYIYKSAKEVKAASGLAKEINPELKSIFTEVFGGAKLTSFTSGFVGPGTAMLVYTTKKVLKAKDSETLVNILEEKNYTIQIHTVSYGSVSIMALKDNLQLVISYGYGGVQQEVTVMAQKEE